MEAKEFPDELSCLTNAKTDLQVLLALGEP